MGDQNLESTIKADRKKFETVEKKLENYEIRVNTALKASLGGMLGMIIGGMLGHGFATADYYPEFLNAVDVGYIVGYFAGSLPFLINGYRKIRGIK